MKLFVMLGKFVKGHIVLASLLAVVLFGGSVALGYSIRPQKNETQRQLPTSARPTTQVAPPADPVTPSTTKTESPTQSGKVKSTSSTLPTGYECKTTVLPHGTKYEDNPYLDKGQTKTYPGSDGKEEYCSYQGGPWKLEYRIEPYDTVVQEGTYEASPSGGVTYDEARQRCARFSGTSAFDQCMYEYGWGAPPPG